MEEEVSESKSTRSSDEAIFPQRQIIDAIKRSDREVAPVDMPRRQVWEPSVIEGIRPLQVTGTLVASFGEETLTSWCQQFPALVEESLEFTLKLVTHFTLLRRFENIAHVWCATFFVGAPLGHRTSSNSGCRANTR